MNKQVCDKHKKYTDGCEECKVRHMQNKKWETVGKRNKFGKNFFVCAAGIFLIGLCWVKMFDGKPYNNSEVGLVGMCLLGVGAVLGFSLGVWWILEKIFRGEYAA